MKQDGPLYWSIIFAVAFVILGGGFYAIHDYNTSPSSADKCVAKYWSKGMEREELYAICIQKSVSRIALNGALNRAYGN